MGPRGQPLCTRNVWYLDYFLPVILRATCLFFIPSVKLYLVKFEGRFWLMGPWGQPLGTRNVWYLDYFLPVILRATCLFSIPSVKLFNLLRLRDAAGCGSNMSYSSYYVVAMKNTKKLLNMDSNTRPICIKLIELGALPMRQQLDAVSFC